MKSKGADRTGRHWADGPIDEELLPAGHIAPDGAALFGTTGGNLITCIFPEPSTPEIIAKRRAFAEKRLALHKDLCRPLGRSATRKPILKSVRRKQQKEMRRWQGCVDRMKNGDPGVMAAWAMVVEENMRAMKRAIDRFKNFQDEQGQPIFQDEAGV